MLTPKQNAHWRQGVIGAGAKPPKPGLVCCIIGPLITSLLPAVAAKTKQSITQADQDHIQIYVGLVRVLKQVPQGVKISGSFVWGHFG